MAKQNEIKKELLRQMQQDSAEATATSANSAWEIIEKHKTQLGRRKWIAATSWLITLVYAVALHNVKIYVLKHSIEGVLTRNEFWLIRYSDMTTIVVIIISVLLTYLVYAKSKTLTILQICARLASIEEHLKKMSQDKSAVSGT